MRSIMWDRARPRRGFRRVRAAIPLGIAALVGLPLVLAAGNPSVGAATANLPVFPDNLLVFLNRDFVTVEGFADHVGQSGTLEVTRPGVGVVGSAVGVVSGGDVAFEVNHPGGYCWGAGTGLNVTPDIIPGDVVSLSFGGTRVAATTTLDVFANNAVQTQKTVVVTGHIGTGVDPANMEQRIIEPALVDTVIGKRDVRAVPGPMTPAAKGGYSSGLAFGVGDQKFTATYLFDNESDATIAANAALGERAMAWEFTDPAGNRQGMTIAENGEPGGPGMGGCPNGPLQSGPPAPTNVVAAETVPNPNPDGIKTIKVNWTPAAAIPGTPAILGYRVTAVARTSANNEQVEIGRRIMNPAAASTTITGLASGEIYDVYVVSLSSTGETFPAAHAVPATDVTPPTVSAAPAGGSYPAPQQVTLTANEFGSDIYYTLDGSDPISGDQVNAAALHYTGPITVSASPTILKFAAFDPSNNPSTIGTEEYSITNNPVPAATTFTGSTIGLGTVTLNWAAADPGIVGKNIIDYQVKVFGSAALVNPVQTVTTGNANTSILINGLTGDTPYWFTVSAKSDANTAWGPASPALGPIAPQGGVVANAGPDQSGVVRNTTVTLSGAASSSGATYVWRQLVTGTSTTMPDGVDKVVLTPSGTNATFTLPFYKYPMLNAPLTFELSVTSGGTTRTDQVVVTPRSDTIGITTAKWKAGDFRVVGTDSSVGATVTLRSPTGTIYGTAVVTAAVAPATGGDFDIRLRNGAAPGTKPPTVFVDSNLGGTAGPFPVAG